MPVPKAVEHGVYAYVAARMLGPEDRARDTGLHIALTLLLGSPAMIVGAVRVRARQGLDEALDGGVPRDPAFAKALAVYQREAAERLASNRILGLEQSNARLREALEGGDLAGRSLHELLSAAADALGGQGGGPLQDCLQDRASSIRAALEPAP